MSNPLNDLNETLKKLLLDKVRSDLAISFDIPTQEWSAHVGQQPTVNLYLYDIRENRELREIYWDRSDPEQGKVTFTQRPIQINLSYLVTCWIKATDQQHLVLWQVLETLFHHSPLPVDILQGDLSKLPRPLRTEVAQPDSVLKNVSEFWGALNNQIRPAINLVVTLGLDLSKELTEPVVGDVTKRVVSMHRLPQLRVMVRDSQQQPLGEASVSLISKDADGIQLWATPLPYPAGYIFESVAPGNYRLRVEVAGHTTNEKSVTIPLRSDPPAEPGDQVVKVSMS